VLVVLAVIVVALGAAVAAFMLRGSSYPPVSTADPDVNAIDPLHQEMRCIDGVLQNRVLKVEQVQPALDRCRGTDPGGNQSGEQ